MQGRRLVQDLAHSRHTVLLLEEEEEEEEEEEGGEGGGGKGEDNFKRTTISVECVSPKAQDWVGSGRLRGEFGNKQTVEIRKGTPVPSSPPRRKEVMLPPLSSPSGVRATPQARTPSSSPIRFPGELRPQPPPARCGSSLNQRCLLFRPCHSHRCNLATRLERPGL